MLRQTSNAGANGAHASNYGAYIACTGLRGAQGLNFALAAAAKASCEDWVSEVLLRNDEGAVQGDVQGHSDQCQARHHDEVCADVNHESISLMLCCLKDPG